MAGHKAMKINIGTILMKPVNAECVPEETKLRWSPNQAPIINPDIRLIKDHKYLGIRLTEFIMFPIVIHCFHYFFLGCIFLYGVRFWVFLLFSSDFETLKPYYKKYSTLPIFKIKDKVI
jgi:hypothetical protein|tara:strand:+ start:1228 stop:1584 length:357 start_codon:yes stop_codon:yes gene_type:complete